MKDGHQIIVQKYGGSSLATPDKIKNVARFIKAALTDNLHICVVVSAMGNTTNDLIAMAHDVSMDPPKRELDMLLSCGERSSMALLAMALSDLSVKAISLTGSQSGIITDDNHMGAEIVEVRPNRVLDEFFVHQVVIIAGFQGISLKKEITTLRRGGSDTTAVAMAAALKASHCEIYTDVAGVMDVDPKIVARAKTIENIGFLQMEAMALYGARVMAYDAIMFAKQLNIELRVKKTEELGVTTNISHNAWARNKSDSAYALTHLRGVIKFSLEKNLDLNFLNSERYFLCGRMEGDDFIGYASNDIAQEQSLIANAQVTPGLALITVHLEKNQFALPLLWRIGEILKTLDLCVKDLILGRNEIFIIVFDDKLNEALISLHTELKVGAL